MLGSAALVCCFAAVAKYGFKMQAKNKGRSPHIFLAIIQQNTLF
jgi:hypothetical protein